jgi:chemotaxis protein methyltransferase CheR
VTAALRRIAGAVREESGITEARGAMIERALSLVDPEIDAATAAARIRSDADLLARVLDEVTVKETFFDRDRGQLDSIDWHVLLRNAKARRSQTIDVWTAGCATGEEAYTLALRAVEVLGEDAPVRILGTDISRTAIARAAVACYRERSVRLVSPGRRAQHFDAEPDGSLRVGAAARRLVRFAHHNLVRDEAPARFDLVLCRNVLIYFDARTVARVLQCLRDAVVDGGMLLLGAADTLCLAAADHSSRPQLVRPSPPPPLDVVEDYRPHVVAGIGHLERGNSSAAVTSLRRALYLQPLLAVAAFQLGRAYESCGDRASARRAYGQTLRTLATSHDDPLLVHVGSADVEAACLRRIEALA